VEGKVIAVASGVRGGVGKSVLSLLIAYLSCKTLRRLREKNYIYFNSERVLLIDLLGGVTKIITSGMKEEEKMKIESPPNLREFITQGNKRSFRIVKIGDVALYLVPWDSNPIEITEDLASEFINLIAFLKKVFGLIVIDFPAFNSHPFYYILMNSDIQIHVYSHERTCVEQIYSSLARVKGSNVIVVLNKDLERYYEWNPVDFLKEAYDISDGDLIRVSLSPYLSLISTKGLQTLQYLEKTRVFSKGEKELRKIGKQIGDLVSVIIDFAISQ